MNVLYKYCDQLGIVKILGALELKLPYISEVNNPHQAEESETYTINLVALKNQ